MRFGVCTTTSYSTSIVSFPDCIRIRIRSRSRFPLPLPDCTHSACTRLFKRHYQPVKHQQQFPVFHQSYSFSTVAPQTKKLNYKKGIFNSLLNSSDAEFMQTMTQEMNSNANNQDVGQIQAKILDGKAIAEYVCP
jgi:hypothetical protein